MSTPDEKAATSTTGEKAATSGATEVVTKEVADKSKTLEQTPAVDESTVKVADKELEKNRKSGDFYCR